MRLRPAAAPLVAALVCLVASGCGANDEDPPAATAKPPPPAFRHQTFYASLQAESEHFSMKDGDWLEDYGDAPFFGLAFSARRLPDVPSVAPRYQAARARARTLLDTADLVNGDVNEYAMSALGLIDAIHVTGDAKDRDVLDAFVDRLDKLVELLGYYLDLGDASWAFQTYGPTSVSALVRLVSAQHAYLLGGEGKEARVEFAREAEAAISERAWDGTRYRFGDERELFCIYPNVAMMLLEARLFQLTGEERYRERALALHAAIQPLRIPGDVVRYRSPYSAEYMGAKTDDYSTLSSHNYLMLALITLYEISGDAAFLVESDGVLDALERELYGSWCLSHVHKSACEPVCAEAGVCVAGECTADACHGGVLHHWIDGRIAEPKDAEYFCSGCNLQLLYAMEYRQRVAP